MNEWKDKEKVQLSTVLIMKDDVIILISATFYVMHALASVCTYKLLSCDSEYLFLVNDTQFV